MNKTKMPYKYSTFVVLAFSLGESLAERGFRPQAQFNYN